MRGELSEIHRNITVLASLGESVIAWEEEDYRAYQTRRLRVDSLLQVLKIGSDNMIDTNQIDTLRGLLSSKEGHLHQIMQVFHRQDKADSLLVNHLPKLPSKRYNHVPSCKKKKGIAGLFGGKETVEVPESPNRLRSLNEQLIALLTERIRNMEATPTACVSVTRIWTGNSSPCSEASTITHKPPSKTENDILRKRTITLPPSSWG